MNYCKIYSASRESIGSLLSQLKLMFQGERVTVSFLETKDFDLSISYNDEFNENLQKNFPEGFLYFEYLIDIEFNEGVSMQYSIDIISRILNWLWKEKKIPAVASCDYENSLPLSGGYNCESVWFNNIQ